MVVIKIIIHEKIKKTTSDRKKMREKEKERGRVREIVSGRKREKRE